MVLDTKLLSSRCVHCYWCIFASRLFQWTKFRNMHVIYPHTLLIIHIKRQIYIYAYLCTHVYPYAHVHFGNEEVTLVFPQDSLFLSPVSYLYVLCFGQETMTSARFLHFFNPIMPKSNYRVACSYHCKNQTNYKEFRIFLQFSLLSLLPKMEGMQSNTVLIGYFSQFVLYPPFSAFLHCYSFHLIHNCIHLSLYAYIFSHMLYRYIYISLYFLKDNIIYMVFYTSLFSLTNISWDLGMIDFCSTEISALSFILMY